VLPELRKDILDADFLGFTHNQPIVQVNVDTRPGKSALPYIRPPVVPLIECVPVFAVKALNGKTALKGNLKYEIRPGRPHR
jgi:hypothetical protein